MDIAYAEVFLMFFKFEKDVLSDKITLHRAVCLADTKFIFRYVIKNWMQNNILLFTLHMMLPVQWQRKVDIIRPPINQYQLT